MIQHVARKKRESEPYNLEWLFRWAIPEPNSGCMLWLATTNPGGYGIVGYRGRPIGAHRLAWILANGRVPRGLDIDHLCRVRCCVNPDHLQAVTRSENLRRGLTGKSGATIGNTNKTKTHCPNGHEYIGWNLYVSRDGHRDCNTCQRERVRQWRARRREQ